MQLTQKSAGSNWVEIAWDKNPVEGDAYLIYADEKKNPTTLVKILPSEYGFNSFVMLNVTEKLYFKVTTKFAPYFIPTTSNILEVDLDPTNTAKPNIQVHFNMHYYEYVNGTEKLKVDANANYPAGSFKYPNPKQDPRPITYSEIEYITYKPSSNYLTFKLANPKACYKNACEKIECPDATCTANTDESYKKVCFGITCNAKPCYTVECLTKSCFKKECLGKTCYGQTCSGSSAYVDVRFAISGYHAEETIDFTKKLALSPEITPACVAPIYDTQRENIYNKPEANYKIINTMVDEGFIMLFKKLDMQTEVNNLNWATAHDEIIGEKNKGRYPFYVEYRVKLQKKNSSGLVIGESKECSFVYIVKPRPTRETITTRLRQLTR